MVRTENFIGSLSVQSGVRLHTLPAFKASPGLQNHRESQVWELVQELDYNKHNVVCDSAKGLADPTLLSTRLRDQVERWLETHSPLWVYLNRSEVLQKDVHASSRFTVKTEHKTM